MHKFTANEMNKFREMASYIRSLDSSVRGISKEDGINIVIAMVNRDRPVVRSLNNEGEAPLVRLGQGTYTKDIHTF
jgi:hypothetical protein